MNIVGATARVSLILPPSLSYWVPIYRPNLKGPCGVIWAFIRSLNMSVGIFQTTFLKYYKGKKLGMTSDYG